MPSSSLYVPSNNNDEENKSNNFTLKHGEDMCITSKITVNQNKKQKNIFYEN